MRVTSLLGVCLIVGVAFVRVANAAPDEVVNLESDTGGEYVSAATIDFVTELGMDCGSLRSLGVRAEEARRGTDPVGLASAAVELAALEGATGEKAKLTSADLMKEAVEMAKMRANSRELKAISMLASDEAVKKELAAEAAKAEKAEAKRAAAAEDGEIERGICGSLHVENLSNQHVEVFYNGRNVGCVDSYSCQEFYLDDHSHAFTLEARGDWGAFFRTHYHGQYNRFNWTLRMAGGHHHDH